jgi:hypothetical protein
LDDVNKNEGKYFIHFSCCSTTTTFHKQPEVDALCVDIEKRPAGQHCTIPYEMSDHHSNNRDHHNPNNLLLVQDLDGWLESNGLRSADDYPDAVNTVTTLSIQEECSRVVEEDRYVQSIHKIAFRDSIEKEQHELEEKNQLIRSWQNSTLDIRTADNDHILNVPLDKMAQLCDTIYIMAKSKVWNQSSKSATSNTESTTGIHISLELYPKSSVQEFVNIVLFHTSTETTAAADVEEGSVGTRIAAAVDQVSDDTVLVDCCRIAHFLMAESIVNAITKVFIRSIDTNNCFIICQLADELNLSSTLFEQTLIYMIDTLGKYDSANNDDVSWDKNDVLNTELKERILVMKRAIETSLHHTNRKSRRVYFASIDEYISIFAERVQYYRERLAEAKESQLQNSKRVTFRTAAWIDTQTKIEKQEQRLRTLETALAEQKRLFRGSCSPSKV